jgi:uncharacterized protein YcgI (DUF1989 family)
MAGRTIQDVVIAPRGHLGVKLQKGQNMRVIDVDGEQVPDIVAINPSDLHEKLSMAATKLVNAAWNLKVGTALYSNRGRAMMTVIADTVGIHHIGGGYCNLWSNLARFGEQGRGPNCHDNLVAALSDLGLAPDYIAAHLNPDMCVCFWMKYAYLPDGRRVYDCTPTKAGDYTEVRADMDLLVAVSACPQDRNNVNGYNPTQLQVTITESEPQAVGSLRK